MVVGLVKGLTISAAFDFMASDITGGAMSKWAELPFENVEKCYGDVADLSFLEGNTVVRIGYLDQTALKPIDRVSGGFAIDYQEGNKIKRVVLGTNDYGLSIEWKGILGKTPEASLRDKCANALDALCSQNINLVDLPLRRGYAFVGANGKEILFLDCFDLKRMGNQVSQHFAASTRSVLMALESVTAWTKKS